MEGGRRRLTLYDQMLALGDTRELAGLTLNDVLTIQKRPSPNPTPAVRLNGRTLLDIIRDDVSKAPADHREKKSWKFLRDRLRLKRSLAAWTSSLEISLRNSRSQIPPRNSLRFDGLSSPPDVGRPPTDDMMPNEESPEAAAPAAPPLRHQISRRNSTRLSPNAPPPPEVTNSNDSPQNTDAAPNAGRSLRAISRHHSTRFSMERSESFADLTEPARDGTRRLSTALAEERSLSAREAVAAQEAADAEATAEAAAAAAAAEEDEDEDDDEEGAAAAPSTDSAAPVRMSLMDLLEETDRQMGFEGSRYRIEEEEEEEEEAAEEAEEEREEEKETAGGGSGVERNCCVCMVRHKGAAFIPCGHTFCRLCSRELWVSRGNCPLCNGFILEILDIF